MKHRILSGTMVVWTVALIVSGIAPYDRLTWYMEVAPVLLAAPVLIATRDTLPLTRLAYVLICAHGLILIAGGAYSYARVPLGLWVRDWLDLDRNPYDRLGHLAQGFVPAIVVRELLLRVFAFARGNFLFFIVVCICLAVSAGYELIEWGAALLLGQGASEFLATQGDEWDTQWDMFLALLGSIISLLIFSRFHDRQLEAMTSRP